MLVVTTHTKVLIAKTKRLAKSLHLDYQDPLLAKNYEFCLRVDFEQLSLHDQKNKLTLKIDFLDKKLHLRCQNLSAKNELLIRALGMKKNKPSIIFDATAGLGKDSFIIAAFGFEVYMFERSLLVYTLLKSALKIAKADKKVALIIKRMHLIHENAIFGMKALSIKPDVVYLDPMFPLKRKRALNKQSMRILSRLLQKQEEQEEKLFAEAMACALRRVVVKRPRLAENVTGQKPNFSLMGQSNRFDVYLL